MLNIEKYVRKPFYVDMVTVTTTNMAEVAEWCGGTVEEEKQGRRTVKFIKVPVVRPMSEKQTKAFPKDKVLKTETGAKVYTEDAFHKSFQKDPVAELVEAQDELPFERKTCGKTRWTIDNKPCVLDADHGKRACTSIMLPPTPPAEEMLNIVDTNNPKFPQGYPGPSAR